MTYPVGAIFTQRGEFGNTLHLQISEDEAVAFPPRTSTLWDNGGRHLTGLVFYPVGKAKVVVKFKSNDSGELYWYIDGSPTRYESLLAAYLYLTLEGRL